jgi:cyclohexa-1,5-dienecarbonyl-CoA hydratase
MPLTVQRTPDVCRLHLDAPPGNILDHELCLQLSEAIQVHGGDADLKAFLLTADGKNFSYGASVQEHVKGKVETFLPAFHDVFEALMASDVPAIAAVRGKCLGGAFELAGFCHFMVAETNAVFALPEIQLGVFPPVACAVFPDLFGRAVIDNLVLGSQQLTAEEAVACGLVTRLCGEGELERTADDFLKRSILPRSAKALRLTTHALRETLNEKVRHRLPELERRYLVDLMASQDAEEGINAFLEKREPVWVNA